MKKHFFLFLTLSIFLLNLASAAQETLGYFEVEEDVTLIQLCADCTYNNITSIIAPNGTIILSNVAMSQSGSDFTYTLSSSYLSDFGQYNVNGLGDLGGTPTVWAYEFHITPNGEPLKGDNFIIFVYIFYILGLVSCVYILVMNIAKLVSKSETVFGVAFSWGVYLALLLLHWLIQNYSTSSFLRDNIGWTSYIFGFTNFLLPLISLAFAMFARSIDKKRPLTPQEFLGRRLLGNG